MVYSAQYTYLYIMDILLYSKIFFSKTQITMCNMCVGTPDKFHMVCVLNVIVLLPAVFLYYFMRFLRLREENDYYISPKGMGCA